MSTLSHENEKQFPSPVAPMDFNFPKPESLPTIIEGVHRLIIIHDVDADGIAAAWCINKGFKDEHSSVLLIPQRAGVSTIPEGLLPTDSVYMVDRTYPWDVLILLSQQVFSVTVIDHHKSAMDSYSLTEGFDVATDSNCYVRTSSSLFFDYTNITVNIDTTHSACMLAHLWVLTHGVDPDTSVETPWFIQYIEDRDIWAWKLPESEEINAGMHYVGHTFENYDQYAQDPLPSRVSMIVDSLRVTGSVVLKTQSNIIKSIAHGPTVKYEKLTVEECWPINIAPERTPCVGDVLNFAVVCVPFTLISDFGNYFLNYDFNHVPDEYLGGKYPLCKVDVVLCYNKTDTGYVYSIRSKYDMIWFVKMFGGGGHPQAAGFSSNIPPAKILDYVSEKLTTSKQESFTNG